MGVSITAYSHLRLTDPHPYDGDACSDADHLNAYAYAEHTWSMRGLADWDVVATETVEWPGGRTHTWKQVGGRCYVPTDHTRSQRLYDGSYGSYGEWRRLLAQAVGISDLKAWWDAQAPHPDRDAPFYEVLLFADNEGCIGPDAAADLAVDFANPHHRAALERLLPETDVGWAGQRNRWLDTYDTFTAGTALAATGGLIRYT